MPELEERETAIFCGYRWKEWLDLAREERAAGIAHRRIHQLIELHVNDAVDRDAQARSRRLMQ